jgi:uncharacterized HAD superfamily protein
MKVALDIDGVCGNSPKIIQSILDERNIKAEFNQYKPLIKDIEDSESLMNEVVTEMFSNRMHEIEPYEDAVGGVANIDKFVGPITFVTSRREEFNENTVKWLNTHFPFLSYALVNRHSEDKTPYLLENGFRFFVEDRLKTANQAAEAGIITFLMNRKWNLDRYTHKNVIRISSLTTFFSLVASKYMKEDK